MQGTHPSSKTFYLFGFPIAHSAAPTLANHCFDAWDATNSPNRYILWSTSKITEEMLEVLRSGECGGSAVTMPLKGLILPYLDEVSKESEATAACNTIVKVPCPTAPYGFKLVGQNTDSKFYVASPPVSQYPSIKIDTEASYSEPVKGAGFVIGGGATTRSAIYALSLLGLKPIFLINRDSSEIHEVQRAFPDLLVQNVLIHLQNPGAVEKHLVQKDSPRILMGVGAILTAAIPPQTTEERMVYTTASAIFTIPYIRPSEVSNGLPPPHQRIFLEMTYKPRNTPMLQVAAAHGWCAMDGIQAMIEQGLAQQRMWYTSTPTIEVGSDPTVLNPAVEKTARMICENMKDIIVQSTEKDRAEGKKWAPISHAKL
ncbi:hypothetical protein AMATHDRAFT_4967 [Amanita thiersii Skay4041]|uniref:Shikimate dehydrogenase substrate binding N-terminal domain-containing protein n=1 Tax=Amanita thiersii Skay4041 TaxID=703135 RepID=A0A2A9NNY3_9AGAR|nr:hypothetical protein AMATHDRAFT_4967 [Amanita thiersii Skay4041]